jgi:hypothetical protein
VSTWGSPLYRFWVIGGLIAIVAFGIVGGLSDPSNQDFILYLIPVIAVYMAGIFILQWRGVNRDVKKSPALAGPTAGLVKGSIGFGAILCVFIFAGVFAYYAGVRGTLYPFGEDGIGFPWVLIPPVLVAFVGAFRSMRILTELGPDGPDDPPDEDERL